MFEIDWLYRNLFQLKLNHDGYLPSFVVLTEGKVNEQRVAPKIPFDPGDVLVFDRGYSDFGWLANLCAGKIYFVTRLKKNIPYRVVERRKVKNRKLIKFSWSLYTLMSILPSNIFVMRNLMNWLNAPYQPKSHSPPEDGQLFPLI